MGWGEPPKGQRRGKVPKTKPSIRRFVVLLSSLAVAATACWAGFENTTVQGRIYPSEENAVEGVELSVPPPFQTWGVRDHRDKNSIIWVEADADIWAARAQEVGCEGDVETFVVESERVRRDLSVQIRFVDSKWIERMFTHLHSAVGGSLEMSIVNWDGDDRKHPRKFVVDVSEQLGIKDLSYADCYYSRAPSWYCSIITPLTPELTGEFGLPKGLAEFWPNHMRIMRCVVTDMIRRPGNPQ